jgi:hypothetical protein
VIYELKKSFKIKFKLPCSRWPDPCPQFAEQSSFFGFPKTEQICAIIIVVVANKAQIF